MKFLKVLLYIVIGLAVLIGILTMIAPTKSELSRSIVINAPKETIWNNVTHFENIAKWSPWNEMDKNMKTTIEGTDGAVGAVYKWEGNDSVGQGIQTIAKMDPMNMVEMHLQFIKPFEGEADAWYQLSDTTGGTKVTWKFSSETPRPFNIMHLFFDAEKMMGGIFDHGLSNLKTLCESEPATSNPGAYQISEVDRPAMVYVGKRATVSFMEIGKFFDDNFTKLDEDFKAAKVEMAGLPSGIFYTYDTVKMNSDMAIAFPVKDASVSVKGWENISVAGGKALMVDYFGDYTKTTPAYMQLGQYAGGKGMKMKWVVEEYPNSPMTEKDTAKWETRIFYYVE